MLNLWRIRRYLKQGLILKALAQGGFKDPLTLATAGLHHTQLKTTPPPFYKLLAHSQLGQEKEFRQTLKFVQLEEHQNLPPNLRLPIAISSLCWKIEETSSVITKLCPDFPDLLNLAEGLRPFQDPLLNLNSQLHNKELAESYWNSFFKSFKLNVPLFPWNDGNLTLNFLSNSPILPKIKSQYCVSVVISVFNAEQYIALSLNSIINQTWNNLEIIIVDDASKDKTANIANDILTHTPNHRVISLKENVGTYAARNIGIKQAKGEYIMNHDADDWAHPQKIELMIQQLIKANALACTSRWLKIDDDTGEVASHMHFPLLRHCTNSILYNRKILTTITGYDEVRLSADERFESEIQAAYGPNALTRIKKPLTIGNQSNNTLTGGKKHLQKLQQKTLYREVWTKKLISQYFSS